jgi:ceramide glucosyltransferase
LIHAIAWVAAIFALVGAAQQFIGTLLVERFVAHPEPSPQITPPVSILKPLCGVEPLTELALESFFLIDYPSYQLVFGVQSATDPVLEILARLRARYPQHDVALVTDATVHGSNRKVSNLINMLPLAKHETLVMSDADIHVPPYFLSSVISALDQPNVGLVTTLYTALPGTPHLATTLGANQINYSFLPGALLARRLGRQDCLGVTMALSRGTLALVGGLPALANHLADDQVLGRLVRAKGLALTLAHIIPATTVPESNFTELYFHELRWARTIRALVPLAYAGSVLQMSLFWAVLCLVFSGGFWAAWLLFFALLLIRHGLARRLDTALRLAKTGGAWLFVLRDIMSAVIYFASYCGTAVNWRGQQMRADPGRAPPSRSSPPAPPLPPPSPAPSVEPLL